MSLSDILTYAEKIAGLREPQDLEQFCVMVKAADDAWREFWHTRNSKPVSPSEKE